MSETFNDVLSNITHGAPLDLSKEEERVNPDESKDEDGQDQATKDDGQLEGEPESDSKEEPEGKDKEEGSSKESETPEADQKDKSDETKDKSEAKPDEKEEEQEPTFEIDGETVTLSQLREWRESGLRLEDYTKKTMDLGTERKQFLENQKSRVSLATDIAEDLGLQQFLAARPEALANLMANPDSTRKMIGNPKAVQEFWADYDQIKKNPRLAAKLAENSEDESVVDTELRKAQEKESMENIVGTLEQFIVAVGEHEHYKDLGEDGMREVLGYVAGLAGVPEDPTHEQQFTGVQKLFNLFFVQEGDEWTIDHRLIQGEYERLKGAATQAAEEKKSDEPDNAEVQKHNKRVDAQLKEEERPPKTPDGQPPSAEQDTPDIPDDFHAILRKLNS